jgi:hypothetical protein
LIIGDGERNNRESIVTQPLSRLKGSGKVPLFEFGVLDDQTVATTILRPGAGEPQAGASPTRTNQGSTMKKHQVGGICTAVLLAASLLVNPFAARAQDKGKPAAAAEAKSARPYPFSGKLAAIDKEKKTITLMGKEKSRTLHLLASTKIVKAGKPATLDDATVGDEIGGQLLKSGDGREEIVSLRIGTKTPAASKSKKEKAKE